MKRQTRNTLLAVALGRFERTYTDANGWTHHDPGRYNGESREEQYNQLSRAKTPDEWDYIIGNISWTHIWCSECGEYRDSGVTFGDGRDAVTICDDCLKEAFMLAFQPQEAKLCDHGFGVGFCGNKQCPNYADSTKVP